jgi:predicted transcriptional regulator
MAELRLDHPVPMTEEEDVATLAAIDQGIQDADEGRVVSAEEVRQRVQQRLSKSSTPKKHQLLA